MPLNIIEIFQKLNPTLPPRPPRPVFLMKADFANYGIRWFDKRRLKDIESLYKIDNQPELFKFMYPKTASTFRYYKDVFLSQSRHSKDHFYVFALTDQSGNIIGWIQYMIDPNRSRLGKLTKIKRNSLVLEVSYAKLFNSTLRNVATNGLCRSLELIKNMDDNYRKHIYITGYTDSPNTASEMVLKKNQFKKLPFIIQYEDELSNVWIREL